LSIQAENRRLPDKTGTHEKYLGNTPTVTTVNFGTKNKIVNGLQVVLNHQVEHHYFSKTISHGITQKSRKL